MPSDSDGGQVVSADRAEADRGFVATYATEKGSPVIVDRYLVVDEVTVHDLQAALSGGSRAEAAGTW